MKDTLSRDALWAAIHAERATLADDLESLDIAAWEAPSLCAAWTIEDVVAHLTAGASTGRLRWLASIAGARFDADVHNQRRLVEQRGETPQRTMERFRAVTDATTAPSGHTPAWLGEIIVHGEDVRRPLGIDRAPPIDAVTAVARFFADRDFTVNSSSAIRGLRLEATDGPFAIGDGPEVRGTTLALTMAMAGREAYVGELTGPGVPLLGSRSQ